MTDRNHVAKNRQHWDERAHEMVSPGELAWAQVAPAWGIWQIPDADLGVIPDVDGLDVIELGCGTAYFGAWLARRGACVTGIDNSEKQLETARALQREHGLDFELIHGNAETVPRPDASFDLAISEYGASLWCDPYAWIPEAARLLRPGGRLIFLTNSAFLMLFVPDVEGARADVSLRRDYFGMHRFEWPDDNSVEFHLPHGVMIALLGEHGFQLERLVELRAPEGAISRYTFVTGKWARRWPTEEIWIPRKT